MVTIAGTLKISRNYKFFDDSSKKSLKFWHVRNSGGGDSYNFWTICKLNGDMTISRPRDNVFSSFADDNERKKLELNERQLKKKWKKLNAQYGAPPSD